LNHQGGVVLIMISDRGLLGGTGSGGESDENESDRQKLKFCNGLNDFSENGG